MKKQILVLLALAFLVISVSSCGSSYKRRKSCRGNGSWYGNRNLGAEPCIDVKDKSCIAECPVDCIYEGDRMLYIQADECVDCGACEPVCPVEAIYYEDDVPPQWKQFGKVNTEFFVEIGSPGGASKVGATGTDHELVKALPPKSE